MEFPHCGINKGSLKKYIYIKKADKRAKLDVSTLFLLRMKSSSFFLSKVGLMYSICCAPMYLKFICCLEEIHFMDIHSSCLPCLSLPVCYRLLLCGFHASCKGGNDCSCSYYTTGSFITELFWGFLC